MNTNNEEKLLKQFLDLFGTNKLCEILRSTYHGKYNEVKSRKDAETILLQTPYKRIIFCKKMPIESLQLFIKRKGKSPGKSRNISYLAFKELAEKQPDNTEPPMQPVQGTEVQEMCSMRMLPIDPIRLRPIQPKRFQPIQPMQVSVYNESFALFQNNDMMPHQSDQAPAQHVSTPVLTTNVILSFVQDFYDLFNNLGIPGKNHLSSRHFYENSTMNVKLFGIGEEINDYCTNSSSILKYLLGIKNYHQLYFSPNLSDGVGWEMESFDLNCRIGGALHSINSLGTLDGKFEQQLVLKNDAMDGNTWKVFSTSLNMYVDCKNPMVPSPVLENI